MSVWDDSTQWIFLSSILDTIQKKTGQSGDNSFYCFTIQLNQSHKGELPSIVAWLMWYLCFHQSWGNIGHLQYPCMVDYRCGFGPVHFDFFITSWSNYFTELLNRTNGCVTGYVGCYLQLTYLILSRSGLRSRVFFVLISAGMLSKIYMMCTYFTLRDSAHLSLNRLELEVKSNMLIHSLFPILGCIFLFFTHFIPGIVNK